MNTNAAHLRISLATLVALLGACSAGADGEPVATGESPNTTCTSGVVLPDVSVEGHVVNQAVPPVKSRGIVLGALDERGPTTFTQSDMIAYADDTGLRRKGWTFTAKRGERFSVDSFVTELSAGWDVYGPVTGCTAARTDAPAPFEGIVGWRARVDGTYFVAPSASMTRGSNGALAPVPSPRPSSLEGELSMRRLLADDTPAGHAFVPTPTPSMYGVSDIAAVTLAGDAAPSVVMTGNRTPLTNGGPAEPPSLVVVRRGSEPVFFAQCQEGLGGIVAGDFDGDGRTDVLSGTNLFKGAAAGSFTCAPSGLRVYGGRIVGPVDVDGDGSLDVLAVEARPGYGTTTLYVTPHFRRGAAFVAGATRTATVPLARSVHDRVRLGYADVTGDGRPEILLGAPEPAAPPEAIAAGAGTRVVAYAVPTLAPEDANAQPLGSTMLPLVELAVAALPDARELDNRGERLFDMDGDGLRDRVVSQPRGFGIAYGKPDGTFHRPWGFARDGAGDIPVFEHLDWDGDGCEDVVLAGRGIAVYRGVRCVAR